MDPQWLWLAGAVFAVAFLYSSVGHAGASGYIAVLTLFGYSAAVIKPSALILNILVSIVAAFQFWRAGYFSWKLFWPFALLSVPAAYGGGYANVSPGLLKILLGGVLWFSAARLFFRRGDPENAIPPRLPAALGTGAGIGFLSGLTGTGGGIFLTPLLLFCRWARLRNAAAVSALFILVNSTAGLMGYFSGGRPAPPFAFVGVLAAGALGGGALGSHFGSRKFPVRIIQFLLAAVLIIAGSKLLFTR